LQAITHFVEQINADQGVVLAFQPVDAVGFAANVTRIKRVVQNVRNPLVGDVAFFAREIRGHLKETPHFCLRAKTARGEALKGALLHKSGEGRPSPYPSRT